jgi:hypothetical protein
MADLTFKKSNYTTITFSGARFQSNTGVTTEDAQYGSSFLSTMLSLSLTHKFTYKISGTVDFSYSEMQFNSEGARTEEGKPTPFNIERNDSRKQIGGELNYQMRDWLGFTVKYSHADNSSNVERESYKRNLFTTEISFTF